MSSSVTSVPPWPHTEARCSRLEGPMLSRIMGHDHKAFAQAILILDEVGEQSLGAESEALEHMLGRILAHRHSRPELLQPPRPRN